MFPVGLVQRGVLVVGRQDRPWGRGGVQVGTPLFFGAGFGEPGVHYCRQGRVVAGFQTSAGCTVLRSKSTSAWSWSRSGTTRSVGVAGNSVSFAVGVDRWRSRAAARARSASRAWRRRSVWVQGSGA